MNPHRADLPRAAAERDNGHAHQLPPDWGDWEPRRPTRFELVAVSVGVVCSAVLIALGVWKATELVAHAV